MPFLRSLILLVSRVELSLAHLLLSQNHEERRSQNNLDEKQNCPFQSDSPDNKIILLFRWSKMACSQEFPNLFLGLWVACFVALVELHCGVHPRVCGIQPTLSLRVPPLRSTMRLLSKQAKHLAFGLTDTQFQDKNKTGLVSITCN